MRVPVKIPSTDRLGEQPGRRSQLGLTRKRETEEERRRRWRVSCAVAVQLMHADAGAPGLHRRRVLIGGVTPVTSNMFSTSSIRCEGGTTHARRNAGASVLLVVPTNATRSGARPWREATGSRPKRYSTS